MGQKHPAPFSQPILDRIYELVWEEKGMRVLDPFAGTGRVLRALPSGTTTTLIEIEPRFIDEMLEEITAADDAGLLQPRMKWHIHEGDSAAVIPKLRRTYTHIITSPTYGNRMSDGFRAKPGTQCRSYAQSVGGSLQARNSGAYKLDSDRYWEINHDVMSEAVDKLVPGGKVILNVSDFYRTVKKGERPERQPVGSDWVHIMTTCGTYLRSVEPIVTRRFTRGENRHRVPYEYIMIFEKE